MKAFDTKQFLTTEFDILYVDINKKYVENSNENGLIIDDYCLLQYVFKYKYKILDKIDYIFVNLTFQDEPYLHLYFFLGKKIFFNFNKNNDENILKKITLNPTINGLYNINSFHNFIKYNIEYQNDIENDICHIDISNILKANDSIYNLKFILKKINLVWGFFLTYNISNLPDILLKDDNNITEFYKNIMQSLGELCKNHPVNDKETKFSYSRDIKFIPDTNRFYSSNIRQPLHNDYAYYPYSISPDWFLLMSLQECDFGGITSIITVKLLRTIIQKYNTILLNRIKNCYINYKYEDIERGSIIHNKKLLTDDNIINWNYFQIKNELNEENTINIKNDLFKFLGKIISDGEISTFKKKWNRGDALLLNDHFLLHERSSFLGERWLKDFSIKDINLKLKI